MLAVYITGHGLGHLTRTLEVLRAVRQARPSLPIAIIGKVPEEFVRRALAEPLQLRPVQCDVGIVQKDALTIDEEETVARCREFDRTWDVRLDEEKAFLRRSGARAVLGDIPPLAFAAAARAGVPSFALGQFGWDWIYRHLGRRHPSLIDTADRAASACAEAGLLLELPFCDGVEAFPRRVPVGLVARKPRVDRSKARMLLGLDGRPAVLVSFGGYGVPGLIKERFADPDLQIVFPTDVSFARLGPLGLDYPDVISGVDVVLSKPGYGIVSDCIGAGARLLYTDRGDFPEYAVFVREMPKWIPCDHIPHDDLMNGRIAPAVRRLLARPSVRAPESMGAERAAARILSTLG